MPDIYQLEHLLSIAEHGTLSKAAEELHLSQSALSRSMQRLEAELQVTLFERKKNRIELNKNGELAVEYAGKILAELQDMTQRIRIFDRNNHTISVGSCAPAPLLDIIPILSGAYPEMTISSEMKEQDRLLQGLKEGLYQIIITTYPIDESDIYCIAYEEEQLFFSLPPGHPLSGAKGLHFIDLDGENMILYSRIGFWYDLTVSKMPSTKFFLQDDDYAFRELVNASALPSFASDIMLKSDGTPSNRILIPILDEEAHPTYYLSCLTKEKLKLASFFRRVENDGI